MLPMGEGALRSERALGHLPVPADFGLELLLEVRLGGHDFTRLHGYYIEIRKSAHLVIFLIQLGVGVLGVFFPWLFHVGLIIMLVIKVKVIPAIDN